MERVIYKKSPLVEVIIQYMFPKILALNVNDPVEFQNSIKSEYPFYQLTVENQQEISVSLGQDNTPVPSIINKQSIKNHNFISQDGLYKINLTSSFISISTVKYTRWEEMLQHFEKPISTFQDIYSPPFYDRIGLRYIDAFSRKTLNLESVSWKDLINQPWLGAFSSIDEGKLINNGVDVEYLLDNDISHAKVHSGIGSINNEPEKVFVIDSDFIHIQNIVSDNSVDILNYLHDNAKLFIRSAITDTLHYAMEPEIVS